MVGGFSWEGSRKDAETQRMEGGEGEDEEGEGESRRVCQNAGFG
jgi:hypothetical protein